MRTIESLHREVGVAIVGGGAAGLAAAHALAQAKVPYVLIDARARLGGRAYTETSNKTPLDLGSGWLHSANKNPWAAIAYKLGFHIDKTRPPWEEQSFDLELSPAEQADFSRAFAAFEQRVDEKAGDDDCPAAALLDPACRWNPLIDAICTYLNGAGIKEVSTADYRNYEDTDVNWRIKEGYGALIAAYGAGHPAALRTRVLCIKHDGPSLTLVTDRGNIRAQQAIVTVPTSAIATETLRLDPELPEKIEAAQHLPLGLVNKLFLACDQPEMFPSDGHLFGDWHTAATGSYHLKPFGHPVVEVFLAGALARDLAAAGAAAHGDFAIGELVKLLGSDVRRHLTPVTQSAWHDDPFVRGSYSYAEVGFAPARETLGCPVEDRLFFAGEACSTVAFATAHGAFQTGIEAARAVIAARAPRRPMMRGAQVSLDS